MDIRKYLITSSPALVTLSNTETDYKELINSIKSHPKFKSTASSTTYKFLSPHLNMEESPSFSTASLTNYQLSHEELMFYESLSQPMITHDFCISMNNTGISNEVVNVISNQSYEYFLRVLCELYYKSKIKELHLKRTDGYAAYYLLIQAMVHSLFRIQQEPHKLILHSNKGIASFQSFKGTLYQKKRRKHNTIISKKEGEELIQLITKEKYPLKEAAKQCKISCTAAKNIVKHFKETNQVRDPTDITIQRLNSLNQEQLLYIKELLDSSSKSYSLRAISELLFNKFGVKLNISTLYYQITHSLKYSYKKITYLNPVLSSNSGKDKLKVFSKYMIHLLSSGKQLIYLDESGFNTHTQRTYGYALKGHKCVKKRGGKCSNISLLMAISNVEVLGYQLKLNSFDELSFSAFLINLSRVIRNSPILNYTDCIIYMDNASIHKSNLVMRTLKILKLNFIYPPAYTCMLNPIEYFFSVLKARVKADTWTIK